METASGQLRSRQAPQRDHRDLLSARHHRKPVVAGSWMGNDIQLPKARRLKQLQRLWPGLPVDSAFRHHGGGLHGGTQFETQHGQGALAGAQQRFR